MNCPGGDPCVSYGDCSGCEGWIGDDPHISTDTPDGPVCVCNELCAAEVAKGYRS